MLLATEELLRQPAMSIKHLQRIVGLWSWSAIFARPSYAIFDAVYRVIRTGQPGRHIRLPPGAAEELRCMCAMAPFLETDLQTKWSQTAFATDSSDIGYGVCQTRADLKEIRAEATYCEMRGWTVCMEDCYATVEESVWAPYEERDVDQDVVEAMVAARPLPSIKTNTYRILHLFSGFRREEDVEWWIRRLTPEGTEVEVLSVDLAVHPEMDLTEASVVEHLRDQCSSGICHGVIAGPPCNSWSRARFRKMLNGPRPLRLRSEPWGRTDITLTKSEQRKVDLGTSLLLATLAIIEAVCMAGGFGLLEHPRDPGVEPFPSIWALEHMKQLAQLVMASFMDIDQCAYGAASQKATTIGVFGAVANDEVALRSLRGRCTHSFHQKVLTGIGSDGTFRTSAAQVYPSGLCRALATVALRALDLMPQPNAKDRAEPSATFPPPTPGRARPERRRGDRVRAPLMASSWERVSRWDLVYKGTWRKTDHTNINELRVAVGLLRHLSRSSRSWHTRHLIFIDSLVALGAASKGRSSSAPLLRLCRQLVPLSLILGIRPYYRYIPSEMNPADGPSRGERVGAADSTKQAHSDRTLRPSWPRQPQPLDAQHPVPKLTPTSLLTLLKQGRDQKGFAGG